jgi:SdrD B-like domain
VVANGAGAITYQWQSSTTLGGTYTNVSGANSSTYTPPSASAGTVYYQVVVSAGDTGCDAITSTPVSVQVNPDLSITTAPIAIIECVGGNEQLSVVVANGAGAITYQWQSSTTLGGTYTDVSGATSSTFTPPSVSAGTIFYQVVVSAGETGCDDIISTPVSVLVNPDQSITAQPTPIVECIGGTDMLSVTVANGAGAITYQWQTATSLVGLYTDISGATSSTYTPPSTTAGTLYYQVIVNASFNGCDDVTSTPVSVQINPDPVLAIQGAIVVCANEATTLFANLSGGAVSCGFQWETSTNGSTWNAISGATANAYTTPNLTDTTYFRVLVNCTGSGCNSTQSATFRIDVSDLTVIGISGPATACPEAISNFTATNVPTGTSLSWSFGEGATPAIANGVGPHAVTYPDCGLRDVQLTATLNGCVDVSTQQIDIQDNVNPVLAGVPANTTVNCNAVPAPANVTATDNCTTPFVSMVARSTQTNNGTCSDFNYVITRTWMAVDACGNRSTGTQTIVVQDPAQACGTVANAIGGVAYVDEDNDGLREGGAGVPNMIVRLYTDNAGSSVLVGTTSTDASGNYQFSGLTPAQRYRVEFAMPGSISTYYLFAIPGQDGGPNVQFVTAPTCNASIGITPSCCK